MSQPESRPDRYVSFVGISTDDNARRVIRMLLKHIDDPEKNNRYWDMFRSRLEKVGQPDANGGRCLDELFLIHSCINNIRELFEQYEDMEALELLEKVEKESC